MRGRRTACSIALLLAACDVYHPEAFDRYDAGFDASLPDAGAGDAALDDAGAPVDAGGSDAGFDAGVDAGPVCDSRRPPPRGIGVGTDGPTVSFALRNVVLAQGGTGWNDLGYDLDETCSDGVGSITCEPRAGASPQIDGADGVDNATGREILVALTIGDPSLETGARAKQDAGVSAIFVTIEGWDGTDDDARVTAWTAQTVYGVPDGGARGDPLRWDGTDTFVVSETDFVDGDPARPLIVDDGAYVSGRQLVMHLPEGRTTYIPWEDNPMTLRLTDAVLVLEINADATAVTAARLAGRWALLDISTSLTQIGVCPGRSDRITIDALVERVADVRSDPTTDSLMLDCDAVSTALGFDGVPARFGGTTAVPPFSDLCGP
ncbi:MAG: hypothetical protein H6719_14695 [Sandaracinaceae bacterium]|nr:hypothetical protein [Sandaracinaceae bacterium]